MLVSDDAEKGDRSSRNKLGRTRNFALYSFMNGQSRVATKGDREGKHHSFLENPSHCLPGGGRIVGRRHDGGQGSRQNKASGEPRVKDP